ncbi:unnamed protein product [Miscanthus lutarioriparius]|uniref:WAT1-related protein n=1 Tax=Miscanthus lutarioriparius TaxID=422564 RepID=A0A811SDR1_9POAL|nr:unnamed protein product [Miscanthus lutarioriparius]
MVRAHDGSKASPQRIHASWTSMACGSERLFVSIIIISIHQGIVATGLAWSLKIWCINKGGPLFIAVFQPLQTVMVAILAAIFLGDQLYTGGVIGAAIIVIGLYSVLWTKSMEKKGACDLETETSPTSHICVQKSSSSIAQIQPTYEAHMSFRLNTSSSICAG